MIRNWLFDLINMICCVDQQLIIRNIQHFLIIFRFDWSFNLIKILKLWLAIDNSLVVLPVKAFIRKYVVHGVEIDISFSKHGPRRLWKIVFQFKITTGSNLVNYNKKTIKL